MNDGLFLLFLGLARADAMHQRSARRIAGRKALVGIDHDLILVVLDPLALVFRVLLRFSDMWNSEFGFARNDNRQHRKRFHG